MFEIDDVDYNEKDFEINHPQSRKPYDPLESLFNDFMYREKSIIKDYWTDEKYKVIFRPNSDRNQMNDNSTIFYYAEEGINEGSLLNISDIYYLTLNKQAIENRIYKQSDLVKCNTIINAFSNGKEIVMPAHILGITSPYGGSGSIISVVGDNIELITQHCELSENIVVGSKFITSYNGRYTVANKEYSGGIFRIYAKREADGKPPTYTLNINLSDAYKVGTAEVLTVVAKRTESSNTEIVTNPTLIWESSNNSIVSFPKAKPNGTASFNSVGDAEIVCIWKEHNLAETGTIVVSSGVAKKCEITYAGACEIKSGGSAKSFTAWFFDDNNEVDTTIVPVWNLEYLSPGQENNVKITDKTGNIVKVQATDKAPTYTTFNLVLTDTSGEYNTKLLIEIVDLW